MADDPTARTLDALDRLDAALARLGSQGLQRMTAASAAEFEALAQLAHHAELPRLERLVETLSTMVRRYLDRDPLFTFEEFAGTVNRAWLLVRRTRARCADGDPDEELPALRGEARRRFTEVDGAVTVQAVCAAGWVSDTDYVGVTVTLHVEGRDEPWQVSNARPVMYFGNEPHRLYREPLSDAVALTVADLAHGAWKVQRARVSRDGRMSVHAAMAVSPGAFLGARAWAPIACDSWAAVAARLRERGVHPITGSGAATVYIEPAAWGPVRIDDKTARAVGTLRDRRGAEVRIEVALRPEHNRLVDNLERLAGPLRAMRPDGLVGRAWVEQGALRFTPLTAVWNEPRVLNDHGRRRVNEVHLTLESLRYVSAGDR